MAPTPFALCQLLVASQFQFSNNTSILIPSGFTICYPRPYLPYEVLWSFFDDFALWPVCSLGPNNFENFEFFKPVLETLGPNKFICETKNHNLFSIVPESAIKLIYTIKHEP